MRAADVPIPEQHRQRQNAVTLLVLQSGHVIDGQVSESPGGYVVDKPNGRMVIPFRLVRFQAANHTEALKKMKQLYPDQNTETRTNIAEWCIAQHMYAEAADELREALERDPDNNDLRLMLDRLETLAAHNQPAAANEPAKPERTAEGFRAAPPESSTGLSPEAVREFTTRIQPILLNKCGNAMCHGKQGEQGFALKHVRGGKGRRAAMEKNLSQVMKYIDTANPRASQLLTVPQGDHGLRKRPVFGNIHDEQLLKAMQTWVKRVSTESTDDKPNEGMYPAFPSKTKSAESSGMLFVGEKQLDLKSPQSGQDAAGPKTPVIDPTQSETPETKSPPAPRDQFDPDAFNRAILGGSRPKR